MVYIEGQQFVLFQNEKGLNSFFHSFSVEFSRLKPGLKISIRTGKPLES